eukprot:UN03584
MEIILDSNFTFQGDGPDEIIPHFLWLGYAQDAPNIQLLRKYGINYILNCAASDISIAYPSYFKVHKFDTDDHWQYNLIDQHLEECITFIDECEHDQDKRILVHCMAGMNRSATISVAYLLHYFKNMNLLEAIEYTVMKRPWILSNGGFRRQLIKYAFDNNRL